MHACSLPEFGELGADERRPREPETWYRRLNGSALAEEVEHAAARRSHLLPVPQVLHRLPNRPRYGLAAQPGDAAGPPGGRGRGAESQAIWLCASCEACTTRCPMGIDIAAVMDALRMLAIERKVAVPDSRGKHFNRSFLSSVRHHGRVFEVGMLAAYKLRTGDLFSDVDKVPQMLAKGKLSLLPHRSESAKRVRELFRAGRRRGRKIVKYAFFPGCSLESTAWDFDRSTRAVFDALGIELEEIPGWVCCGSTPAHASNASLEHRAAGVQLCSGPRSWSSPVLAACASCYARLRTANYQVRNDPKQREQAERITGEPYDGSVMVYHVLDALVNHLGLAAIRAAVRRPLAGLRVACYYGCLLTRPPEVVAFDDAEHPTAMDELVAAWAASRLTGRTRRSVAGPAFR